MSVNNFDIDLQHLHDRSVGRLLTAEVFDKEAFDSLKALLCAKAEALKNEYVVSKQILQCLLLAIQAIESRAEYLPEVKKHAAMANEFQLLISLVANGGGCNDRKPGVPRIL